MKNKYSFFLKTIPAAAMVMTMVLVSGCSGKNNDSPSLQDTRLSQDNTVSVTSGTAESSSERMQMTTETTTQAHGVKYIHFYMPDKDKGVRTITNEFSGKWEKGKDILSLEVFAADTPTIPGKTFQSVWKEYWESFENSADCRIGYTLNFKLKSGEEIKRTVKSPKDVEDFFEYLEIYLYDDVHQIPGNWYSHITEPQIKEDSILTSIKLTAGSKFSEIAGDIKVQAFVYSTDSDFDSATGTYKGNVSVSIDVRNAG